MNRVASQDEMVFPEEKNVYFPVNLGSSPRLYYSKILGPFYRKKLAMLCSLLPNEKRPRVLELGYGSGIALKKLSSHFDNVDGIEVHEFQSDVEKMIKNENLTNVRLFNHNLFEKPLEEKKVYDCVLSSSVFEHIDEEFLGKGVEHVKMALKDDGVFLVGFPLKSLIMNSLFGIYGVTYKKFKKDMYDFSVKEDHPSGEPEIVRQVEKHFVIEEKKYFLNSSLKLYAVIKCRKN